MTRKSLSLMAALGSAALLVAVFIFQAFGYAPCALCIWQRWPHAAAVAIGLLIWLLPQHLQSRLLPVLGGIAALTSAGIGVFHSGVERKYWAGLESCSGTGEFSLDNLMSLDVPSPALCDAFDPLLFGLTMANGNVIASLILAGIWFKAATLPR